MIRCRLFNIGNTRTEIADLAEDGVLFMKACLPTVDFSPEPYRDAPALAVASVVPSMTEKFRGTDALIVRAGMPGCPVGLSRMLHPESIGADRLANAGALISLGRLPALCVDCGTAINMEFVDKSGSLLGGAILPGRLLQRKVLHDYTGNKLPVTALTDSPPLFPGNQTRDALDLGIDAGIVGAVRELIVRMKSRFGDSVFCCACGGDAPFFLRQIPELTPAPEHFTLSGIAALWRSAVLSADR